MRSTTFFAESFRSICTTKSFLKIKNKKINNEQAGITFFENR